jgi:hypothetical protein
VRIFVEIEQVKDRGVIFWLERIGSTFPTICSSHDFGQIL